MRRLRHPEAALAEKAYRKPLRPAREEWLIVLKDKQGEKSYRKAKSYVEAKERALSLLDNPRYDHAWVVQGRW